MDARQRLFFALLPPADVRDRIGAAARGIEEAHPSGGRLLKPDRYHLTLRFLGDADPLPPMWCDAARAAGDAVRPRRFDLVLDHAGSFCGGRVRWLGGQPSASLLALRQDLDHALARTGLEEAQAPFVPHLTIARDARVPLGPVTIEPIRWPVGGFALVLGRPGRPYEILQRWEEGAA
jgi:2'-5' RNA ligase